jgi:hypothetical protein
MLYELVPRCAHLHDQLGLSGIAFQRGEPRGSPRYKVSAPGGLAYPPLSVAFIPIRDA